MLALPQVEYACDRLISKTRIIYVEIRTSAAMAGERSSVAGPLWLPRESPGNAGYGTLASVDKIRTIRDGNT